MADLLLHQRFQAASPDEATVAVRAVFGAGTLTAGLEREFEYRQESLVDDGITVTRIRSSGSAVRVETAAAPDLSVVSVRTGEVELRQEAGALTLREGDLGVMCLHGAARLQWDRVEMQIVSFPAATLARLLSVDHQQLRLRCERLTPKSAAMGQYWQRQAAVLAAEVLQKDDLFGSDMIRDQAIDALLAVAVEAFGIADAAEENLASDEDQFARADSFMRRGLSESITMPEVARAAGLSLRGLELLFRRGGQGTPQLHLRQLRMAAAREALSAPTALGRTTVGAIARGLSYTNLGHFSAHYREAFGESPSSTLREVDRAAAQ